MSRIPSRQLGVAGALVCAAALAAGCGSGGSTSASQSTQGSTGAASAGGAYGSAPAGSGGSSSSGSSSSGGSTANAVVVKTTKGKLGTYLVDGEGKTLYLFEKDKSPKSTCYGGCAAAWPPFVTTGKPKAGGAVKASLLGTSKRKDDKLEVTYAGHPLYWYEGDSGPGQTNGQDLDQFGAEWYVVGASGKKLH